MNSLLHDFWDLDALFKTPASWPATGMVDKEPGVKAVFLEGLPWRGQPTRFFAWVGLPDRPVGRAPGMVLVHGGGGTAYADWVRLWTARGYAAIAMDNCSCIPMACEGKWIKPAFGGPAGWDNSFQTLDEPIPDQWPVHAVAAILRSHSYLRSLPEVDPDRIGLTGISWGGYLTCLTAGVDARFRFAVPVYGCGFLDENSAWLPTFEKMGPEQTTRWASLWDPRQYLPAMTQPMVWLSGTNDFAYPMNSWRKSHRLSKGDRTLCLRVAMPHGHLPGWAPAEIHTFANALFAKEPPLIKILESVSDGTGLRVRFQAHPEAPPVKAELCFTQDKGPWQTRKWQIVPAQLGSGEAHAKPPADATAWYMNLTDRRDLVVSSEHCE